MVGVVAFQKKIYKKIKYFMHVGQNQVSQPILNVSQKHLLAAQQAPRCYIH